MPTIYASKANVHVDPNDTPETVAQKFASVLRVMGMKVDVTPKPEVGYTDYEVTKKEG